MKKQQPIMEFKDLNQAEKYLKEWKERLFLNNWIIKVNFVDANEMPEYQGCNNFSFVNKSSVINLVRLTDDMKTRIVKTCQEVTLVHELLHLKLNLIENADTYEGKLLEITEHALIEELARSLIMAKYNINSDWFLN